MQKADFSARWNYNFGLNRIMVNTQLTDGLLFVTSLLTSVAYCYFLFRHPAFNFKKGLAFVLVFLAQYALLNMSVHLIAVTNVALLKARAGTFEYDLRFYTLIQFGVLLFFINLYLLRGIKQITRGNWTNYRNLQIACGLQILITLPLFPFNPISLLPAIVSVLLLSLVGWAYRRRLIVNSLKVNTKDQIQQYA